MNRRIGPYFSKGMQGSMDRPIGPNFEIGIHGPPFWFEFLKRDLLTAKLVLNFKKECRDPLTAKLARILK